MIRRVVRWLLGRDLLEQQADREERWRINEELDAVWARLTGETTAS